jgi:hypothetical protein
MSPTTPQHAPADANSARKTLPRVGHWPIEGHDAWDRAFRAWAETLLLQLDGFGGMISMLVGQFIACAWRVRHVNYYELPSGGMNNRDWMRMHKFAQHACSRAQIDLVRWMRLLLSEWRRRAKLGDPQAEAKIAALLELPPLPPPPDLDEVYRDAPEPAKADASTDTLNYVPTSPPPEAAGEPRGAVVEGRVAPEIVAMAPIEAAAWPVLVPA